MAWIQAIQDSADDLQGGLPPSEDAPGRMVSVQIDAALVRLMEEMPDAVILLDETWRLVYANRTARRVSHIAAEQIGRMTLWERYPDLVGSDLETTYREAMAAGVERRVPDLYYEPFERWFDIRVLPMGCGLALHYQDITEMRAAQTERDGYAAQLHQAMEATSDTVVAVDREWRISYMNTAAKTMLAASSPAVGARLWELFPAAVEENLPFVEHYYRAMDEGVSSDFEAFYPEPLNMWISVMARPTDDGIIVFSRDITEQKRTTAALIQSEKLAAVGRLASTISHEINNPLAAVTNLVYLAAMNPSDPEAAEYLKMAEVELARVSLISAQTLRFHRQSTRPTPTTCLDLFSSVLTIYDGRLKKSRITLEKRKRAERSVICLEGEVRQVVSNLVGNAIDAMPKEGRLVIRSREGSDWATGRKGLVLTVADTGGGIDAATRGRLFEAFYTTKGEHGNGLGLWISAGIVKRHGGRLQIRSSQDPAHHGTVATLFLPFDPEASLTLHLAAARSPGECAESSNSMVPAMVA